MPDRIMLAPPGRGVEGPTFEDAIVDLYHAMPAEGRQYLVTGMRRIRNEARRGSELPQNTQSQRGRWLLRRRAYAEALTRLELRPAEPGS